MKRVLLGFAVPLLMYAQTDSSPARKLFAEFFEDYLRLHPEAATAFGRAEYDDHGATGRRRAWSSARIWMKRTLRV